MLNNNNNNKSNENNKEIASTIISSIMNDNKNKPPQEQQQVTKEKDEGVIKKLILQPEIEKNLQIEEKNQNQSAIAGLIQNLKIQPKLPENEKPQQQQQHEIITIQEPSNESGILQQILLQPKLPPPPLPQQQVESDAKKSIDREKNKVINELLIRPRFPSDNKDAVKPIIKEPVPKESIQFEERNMSVSKIIANLEGNSGHRRLAEDGEEKPKTKKSDSIKLISNQGSQKSNLSKSEVNLRTNINDEANDDDDESHTSRGVHEIRLNDGGAYKSQSIAFLSSTQERSSSALGISQTDHSSSTLDRTKKGTHFINLKFQILNFIFFF